MAQADVAKAQAELVNRQAAATFAQTARGRAERLLALKSIPRQEYERALADDAAAAAALKQAEAELARATAARAQLGADAPNGMIVLRSPIDGVVIARDAMPGAVVGSGAPLLTVTDPASLWLTAAATEQAAQSVHVGTRLRFSVDAFAADTFAATVQSVAGAFDPSTRSLPIRALVSNDNRKLRPEMFAKVWVEGATATNAFIVPESAIQRLDEKATVFVAHPDGKGGARFEKREVEIRWAGGGRAAIARGLSDGDLIVVSGAYAVKAEFARLKLPKMEM
jgi:cobalt-zinc-cadmium efflux system membrane fusion protein